MAENKSVTIVEVGQILSGTVIKKLGTSPRYFGALIELPGTAAEGKKPLTGLLHVAEFPAPNKDDRQDQLNDLLLESTVEVEVIAIEHKDGKERISLSQRSMPEKEALSDIPVGTILTGTLVNLATKEKGGKPYGLFVRVTPYHSGMLHSSELVGSTREEREDGLTELENKFITAQEEGREVHLTVEILEVDTSSKPVKITLSQRSIAERKAQAEALKERSTREKEKQSKARKTASNLLPGQIYMGKVTRREESGFQLKLEVPGVDAVLPTSELCGLPPASVSHRIRVAVKAVDKETGAVTVTRDGVM